MDKVIPVRVALRCRPLIQKEKNEGCETCLTFIPGEEQVVLGADKSFTFDYVFTPDTPQVEVYERAVSHLVDGIFKGYNATVLAYGQTGSGKTYSMGGGYEISLDTSSDVVGIIPRMIRQLYEGIEESTDFSYVVRVSYLEIYKEDLIDLLQAQASRDSVTIREFEGGQIKLVGLTERVVASPVEMLRCLTDGANMRTTASTAMNTESSRSHAIFTVYIDKTNKQDSQDFTRSKFHLVDLAGSERQKKTKAEGERLKEGININKGLLALGNVISALGDEAQRAKYVPYRDSKLTRLLQDSLGGNSHTVMIACCSPADSNMEETLSTLRYADRARKIKNKPIVNRDPQVAEIMRLKAIVRDLQMQMVSEGITIKNVSEVCASAAQVANSAESQEELKALRQKVKELQDKIITLERDLELAWEQNELQCAKVMVLEAQKEAIQSQLSELKKEVEAASFDLSAADGNSIADITRNITKTWQERLETIEKTHNGDVEFFNLSTHVGDDSQTASVLQAVADEETPRQNVEDTVDDRLKDFQEAAQQKHDDHKAQLFRTLNDLNKRLNEKEQLMRNMEQSDGMISQLRSDYEGNIKEKEDLISRLQTEKEELESQLKQTKVDTKLCKVNEMRRKKIQELEAELKERKRALAETTKMLKIKENSSKDMDRLKRDIVEMKQQRVKLMKQIKQDGEEFRKFKQQKDKEVIQLKAKERKRLVEINKLKGKFEMQQAVLKRKNEEAAALSKRLNENLLKQRKAFEDKAKKEQNQSESKKARIVKLINQELDMVVGVEEARQHKEELVTDRKELSEQLAQLKDELESMPAGKRQQLNDSSGVASDEQTRTLRRQIKDIEMQIQVKSSHIHDLQNKIMEADQHGSDKSKRPFYDDLRSMTEYRIGMNHLVNKVKNSRIAHIKQRSVNEEMAQEIDELTKQLEESEALLLEQKAEQEEEKTRLQRNHEEKILFFLSELNKKNTSENMEEEEEVATSSRAKEEEMNGFGKMSEKLQCKTEQIQASLHRERELQQQIELKNEEIRQLKQELTKKAYTSRANQSLMPNLNETVTYKKGERLSGLDQDEPGPAFFSHAMLPTPAVKKQKRRTLIFEEETSEEEEEELEEGGGEMVEDADWVSGLTPGYNTQKIVSKVPARRGLVRSRGSEWLSRSSESGGTANTPPSGLKCSCRSGCSSRRCACYKADGRCSDYCKCSETCENRELPMPESTTNDDEVSQESAVFNTTFVKDDDTSRDLFRDSTNTSRDVDVTGDNGDEEEEQPRKFRKSSERTREAVRDENASDVSADGLAAKPAARKRKLNSKKSTFFNPV